MHLHEIIYMLNFMFLNYLIYFSKEVLIFLDFLDFVEFFWEFYDTTCIKEIIS